MGLAGTTQCDYLFGIGLITLCITAGGLVGRQTVYRIDGNS
jgi:hypothetical protein